MRRPAALFAAAILLSAVLIGSAGADAATSSTKDERDRVRAEKARTAANIDTLRASRQALEVALADLQADVVAQENRLEDTQRAVDTAQRQYREAQSGIASTSARLGRLNTAMRKAAIEAYVEPRAASVGILAASSASEAVERDAIRQVQADRDADLADQIRAARAELQSRRRTAATARERATRKRAEARAQLGRVTAARARQQKVAAGVQDRIDSQLARVVALASQDRALSVKLAREQAALQARLVAARAAAAAAAAAQAAQADRATRSALAPAYGDGGSESGPVTGPGPSRPTGGNLCSVGGITVSCQVSGQLGSMLSAAASSGLRLSGGGYRDPSQQIAVRQANCGSSYYAIYEMPASSCSPPTAQPGQSMHEVGLAVDFNNCSSRSSACYRWLSGNASRFGFYNLPSEPWHWSVNGN